MNPFTFCKRISPSKLFSTKASRSPFVQYYKALSILNLAYPSRTCFHLTNIFSLECLSTQAFLLPRTTSTSRTHSLHISPICNNYSIMSFLNSFIGIFSSSAILKLCITNFTGTIASKPYTSLKGMELVDTL